MSGIIPRNETEKLFINYLQKAHYFLNEKLNLNTNLDQERVCYWGNDAFHSGFYKDIENKIVINFRNLYGFSLKTIMIVLGHEFRHAYQYKKGYLEREDAYRSVKNPQSHNRMEKGIWKGKEIKLTKYFDLPWEKDARAYENKYANIIFKSNIIPKKDFNILLPGDKTTMPLRSETAQKLYKKFGEKNVEIFKKYSETKEQYKKRVERERKPFLKELKSIGYKQEDKSIVPINPKKKIKYNDPIFEKVQNLVKKINKIKSRKIDDRGICYLTINQINGFKAWNRKAVDLAFNEYEELMQKQFIIHKTKELTVRDLTC